MSSAEDKQEAIAWAWVNYLNGLMQIDVKAIDALVEARVPCNVAMADHETVQVATEPIADRDGGGEKYLLGLLGLINGFIGTRPDGRGYITAHFNNDADDGTTLRHFALTQDRKPGWTDDA